MRLCLGIILTMGCLWGAAFVNEEEHFSIQELCRDADFTDTDLRVSAGEWLLLMGQEKAGRYYLEQEARLYAPDALVALGRHHLQKSQYSQAIQYFECARKMGAVEGVSDLAEAYYQFSRILCQVDVWDERIKELLQKAVKLHHADAGYALFKLSKKTEDLKQAAKFGHKKALYKLALREIEKDCKALDLDDLNECCQFYLMETGNLGVPPPYVGSNLEALEKESAVLLLKKAAMAGCGEARALYWSFLIRHGADPDQVIKGDVKDLVGHLLLGWVHLGWFNMQKKDLGQSYYHFSMARRIHYQKGVKGIVKKGPTPLRMMAVPNHNCHLLVKMRGDWDFKNALVDLSSYMEKLHEVPKIGGDSYDRETANEISLFSKGSMSLNRFLQHFTIERLGEGDEEEEASWVSLDDTP